jgi:hypothetical protein
MRTWKSIGFIALFLGSVSTAHADTITGDISIYSAVNPVGGDLGTATGVDFTGGAYILGDPAPTGTFEGAEGTGVSLRDLDLTTGSPTASSIATSYSSLPLWTFTYGGFTYSFSLTSLTIVSQTSGSLTITGTGVFTSSNPAIDSTTATWTFTASGGEAKLTISQSTPTTSVPESGSTLALFAVGLLGIAVLGRKLA